MKFLHGFMVVLVVHWLVHSPTLDFSFAAFTFFGLFVLLDTGWYGGQRWIHLAYWLAGWQLFEHSLLLMQALFGHPVSVLQLVFPRVHLHLFYNTLVTVPFLIGCWYRARGLRSLRHALDGLACSGTPPPHYEPVNAWQVADDRWLQSK